MIDIKAEAGNISIGPMDRNRLDGIVELYNCSGGYRYATGITFPVTRDDIVLKLDMLETSKNEFFSGIFSGEPGSGEKEVIGVVSGVFCENTLWIKLIAILPQFRMKGMGSIAAGLTVERSREEFGITDVYLSVVGKNEAGVRFWVKQGFRETGRFTKMLFGDASPYEVVIMHKKLQSPHKIPQSRVRSRS